MYNGLKKQIPQNAHNAQYLKDFPAFAQEYLQKPIAALPYSKFCLFQKTGSRVEYEADYIDHRRRTDVFAILVLCGRDEYIAPLQDSLAAICEEYTWALPAHVRAGAAPQEEITRIDLFASETAFMLSEILYLCEDKLDKTLCLRLRYELDRRIVQPYLASHPTWGKNNWSAVCANGVLTTMIYLGYDREFAAAEQPLLGSLQDFLDSYEEDGCCKEGILYWAYGFGNFVYAASLLREYTGGRIDYFASRKVKAIARFGFAIYFDENLTIPYSDGPHRYNYHIGLYHYLKKEYPELSLPDPRFELKFGDETRYRYADLSRNLFWYDEALCAVETARQDQDYPQTQWYLRHTDTFDFSCKGGHNDEPHNHNDVGSFFVLRDGEYLLDDLGWPEYDRDYFKPQNRYHDYICSMSQGHSLPIFGQQGQMYGKEHGAKILGVQKDQIVMDLSGAYDIPGLQLVRRFDLTQNTVQITDSWNVQGSVTERFVTRVAPVAVENGVRIGSALLVPSVPAKAVISTAVFTPRLVSHIGLKDEETAYLIDFTYNTPGTCSFTLQMDVQG